MQSRPRSRAAALLSARWRGWMAILSCLVAIYVGSYFAVTRYSLRIGRRLRITGVYYVPCHPRLLVKHRSLQHLNGFLAGFYLPIRKLDRGLFGGPSPAGLPEAGIGGGQ